MLEVRGWKSFATDRERWRVWIEEAEARLLAVAPKEEEGLAVTGWRSIKFRNLKEPVIILCTVTVIQGLFYQF